MLELFESIWARFIAFAGGLLVLAGIYWQGHKAGKQERVRDVEAELDEHKARYEASQKEAENWRSEARVWRSRYDELSANPVDRAAHHKLEDVRSVIQDGKSLWFRRVLARVAPVRLRDGGPPIITIGNLKGGVGKTTLSAHIAAAFAQDKRVLFVDLDYQGTGSSLLLRAAEMQGGGGQSRVERLLKGFSDYTTLEGVALPLGQFMPNLSVVSAHHALADVEESLMLKWVIGDEADDIRFNLSKALQSPAFKYDLVVIDAPPRLTTAMAQALAASTHVLIPTQLERKSTEAALYFAGVIREFASSGVNPDLNVLGVVPNMVQNRTGYAPIEQAEISYLNEELDKVLSGSGHVWESCPIYDKVAFARPRLVFHQPGDAGANEAAAAINILVGKIAGRIGFEG